MAEIIQKIKIKRGLKANLIEKLKDDNILLAGEPAFETDTGQLKIGNGVNDYESLPYVGGSSSTEDPRFVITDPDANQLLLYDSNSKKWVNKKLADENSIIYLSDSDSGLTIKGYDAAEQGYMLVKDLTNGLAWVKPLDDTQLQSAVASATTQAQQAGQYATNAGNSATEAATSAATASRINQQTMTWVNNKFWWGTLEEYNNLESISSGTFYFITAES